jgi:polar amino acid transport system substrate-binding protein
MSINPTLPPQQFADEKGELQGLNVELMREIAHRLCVPLDLIRMDFPPMIPALQAARFDGINTGMFWTEERSKIAYTVPYAQQTISLTVTKDSALKLANVDALAGRKAGVEVNSYQERWLRGVDKEAVAKGAKPIEILTFKTATDVLAALRAGQARDGDPDRPDGQGDRTRGLHRNHGDRAGAARRRDDGTAAAPSRKVAATLTAMKSRRLLRASCSTSSA